MNRKGGDTIITIKSIINKKTPRIKTYKPGEIFQETKTSDIQGNNDLIDETIDY